MSKPRVFFHRTEMSVPVRNGFRIINYTDVLWLLANGQYTQLALRSSNSGFYIYESLTQLERVLPTVFCRCHRSVIVNICHIQSFDREGIRVDDQILPVAKNKLSKITHLLANSEMLTYPLCKNCNNCPEFAACTSIRPFIAKKIS